MKVKMTIVILMLIITCLFVQPVFAKLQSTGALPGAAPVNSNNIVTMASAYPVQPHSIVVEVSEVGKISWSVDGLGVYPDTTGIIQVEKPAGATVKSAYLLAATTGFSGYQLLAGDITIDNTPINTWDITTANHISSFNYMTDVTSIVKSKIDAAPAGRVDIGITEGPTALIDGEILVVIFNDPAQTTDNTIVILFGAQQTLGDDFNIGVAEALDKSDPNLALDFSLGISFGAQPGAGVQYSLVDVNGQRMTSSAGGDDDGTGPAIANGELLTVGGLDDFNTNPANPNAIGGFNKHDDDELFSLLPFVNTGDTQILVHTLNPSNDDNIFFAGLFLRSATAVVGEGIILSPASATNLLNTQHTVTATLQDATGAPIIGRLVSFTITAGPNTGVTGTAITDSSGHAQFTYTSNSAGTDTMVASFVSNTQQTITSNEATKTWGSTPVPEFPSMFLPATMIIGFLGAVLLIQRTREN